MGINSTNTRNFIRLENILIIGNGGRENSLAWAIQKNELVKKVYLIPGNACLLYTSPSPRDRQKSRMPSSA